MLPQSSQHPASYRRGDPLDIPLVDNHLAVNLLFPRIISAIQWVFPKLHLDWTTGADGGITNANEEGSGIKNPLLWKRLVEILLHITLLLGSSQLLLKRDDDGSLCGNISIRTPAMRNLGMFLKPSSTVTDVSACNTNNRRRLNIDELKVRLQLYSKLLALVAATVIGPRLYEELKHRRQQQLREQERQRRSIDMHMISPRHLENNVHNMSQRDREQDTIRQRANDRRSYVQTMLSDFIIGAVDVFLPPLKLINYISYLWGVSSSPDLGMRFVGWDYDSFADASSEAPTTGFGQNYQRHANFHYGNRRLLVEEALRTVSVVIPPRESAAVVAPSVGPSPRRGNATNESGNRQQTPTRPETADGSQPNLDRRRSWFRKRALSFVGVVEENNATTNENQFNLTCIKCGAENPTVPYMASCGHCYCYICLRMAVTDDLDCHCLDCGKQITSSHRVDFSES